MYFFQLKKKIRTITYEQFFFSQEKNSSDLGSL